MDTMTLNLSPYPFANISVASERWPSSMAMLFAIQPLSTIYLSIVPQEPSVALLFIVLKLTHVLAIFSNLKALHFVSILMQTFIKIIVPDSDTKTTLNLTNDLTKVKLLVLFEYNLKVLQRYKICNFNSLVLWLIVLDERWDLLFWGNFIGDRDRTLGLYACYILSFNFSVDWNRCIVGPQVEKIFIGNSQRLVRANFWIYRLFSLIDV